MASGCSRQRIKEEAEENGRNGKAQVNEQEKNHLCFCTYLNLCFMPPETKGKIASGLVYAIELSRPADTTEMYRVTVCT